MKKQLIIDFFINLIALVLVKVTLYFLGYGEVLFDFLTITVLIVLAAFFTYVLDYRRIKKSHSE